MFNGQRQHALPQILTQRDGTLEIGLGQQADEFLAPIARHEIGGALERGLQREQRRIGRLRSEPGNAAR